MKFNLAKLAKILGQLVLAAPTIFAAVRPIIKEVKGPTGNASATNAPTIAGD
jgi:hypothetical protein